MKTVQSVQEMLTIAPVDGQVVKTLSFHEGLGYGGGEYKFNSTTNISQHTGGDILSINALFPSDWNNETQKLAWFNPAASNNGAWIRQDSDVHNILNYGAMKDGSMLINVILNKMADNDIAIYLPRGKYKVEGFRRNIPHNGNINMTSLIMYGDPTYGNTDQNYSWDTCTVIQGAGDMFLDTVNTAIRDVLFRNTPGAVKGKIFTLGAYSQCEMANCTFGPSNYHFYNEGFGIDGYNVKPFYRNCRFYGAEIWSRYYEGVVANYHEQDCYTSHNKKGLYIAAPVTAKIDSCVYEYNDDGAIVLDAYGYKTTYNLQICNVFFETNNAGPYNNYRDRSGPTITVKSPRLENGEPDPAAAEILFEMRGCYFVDVTDKATAYGCVYVDSKTFTAIDSASYVANAISDNTDLYTGSIITRSDFTKNYVDTKNSIASSGNESKFKKISYGYDTFFDNGGAFVQMENFGHSSKFVTLAASQEYTFFLSRTPGAVVNGDIYITASNNNGYSIYKYRFYGTSTNKNIKLIDSNISGGPVITVGSDGDPVNHYFGVRNGSAAANLTISFCGTCH